jgi:putative ABC transport system permease protein
MVLGHSLKLAVAGLVIGLLLAVQANRVLRSLLYEISPADPLTLGGASVLLLVFALLASYLPARRASRVDPMVALRAE